MRTIIVTQGCSNYEDPAAEPDRRGARGAAHCTRNILIQKYTSEKLNFWTELSEKCMDNKTKKIASSNVW